MNQTEVRTFKAASMQEALDTVRRELGPDAVILQTRELRPSLLFRWRSGVNQVEVTAGTGVNVRSAGMSSRPAAPVPAVIEKLPTEFAEPVRQTPNFGRAGLPANGPFGTASAFESAKQADGRTRGAVTTDNDAAISRQLSTIQQMVSQLTKGATQRGDEVPTELFQLYTELIDADVDEELARNLARQLKQSMGGDELADGAAVKARLRRLVEADIRCAAPISATTGKRRVVALIGPTGVGKTTTIAKLAANFRLRDGIRMGLVTVDTYRIAAVEQLRTYAEIIDLPMKVVTSPREMRRALDELSGLDLVLIDTAGRSPRDELKIQELKSLLAEAQVDEVHLVLSLVSSPKSLQAMAERFAPAGATAMILTKLDESVGMGSLLSVSRRIELPISYLTTGQDVPDDIEHAEARRISRLVLGEENLFNRRRDSH